MQIYQYFAVSLTLLSFLMHTMLTNVSPCDAPSLLGPGIPIRKVPAIERELIEIDEKETSGQVKNMRMSGKLHESKYYGLAKILLTVKSDSSSLISFIDAWEKFDTVNENMDDDEIRSILKNLACAGQLLMQDYDSIFWNWRNFFWSILKGNLETKVTSYYLDVLRRLDYEEDQVYEMIDKVGEKEFFLIDKSEEEKVRELVKEQYKGPINPTFFDHEDHSESNPGNLVNREYGFPLKQFGKFYKLIPNIQFCGDFGELQKFFTENILWFNNHPARFKYYEFFPQCYKNMDEVKLYWKSLLDTQKILEEGKDLDKARLNVYYTLCALYGLENSLFISPLGVFLDCITSFHYERNKETTKEAINNMLDFGITKKELEELANAVLS